MPAPAINAAFYKNWNNKLAMGLRLKKQKGLAPLLFCYDFMA